MSTVFKKEILTKWCISNNSPNEFNNCIKTYILYSIWNDLMSTREHFLLSIFNTVLPALLKRSSFWEKFPLQMQRTDVHACCTCHCRFENSYWWITPCFIFTGCQHLPKNNWKTHKCYFQGNYFKKCMQHSPWNGY